MAEHRLASRLDRICRVLEERETAGETPSWAEDFARENIEERVRQQGTLEGRRRIREANAFWKSLGIRRPLRFCDYSPEALQERIMADAEGLAKIYSNLEACVQGEAAIAAQRKIGRVALDQAIARQEAKEQALAETDPEECEPAAMCARPGAQVAGRNPVLKPSAWPEPRERTEPLWEGDF